MNTRNTKFQFDVDQLVDTDKLHEGRIVARYQRCPMKPFWINTQPYYDSESINKPWYDIKLKSGLCECFPEYLVYPPEPEPEEEEEPEPELCEGCSVELECVGHFGDKKYCMICFNEEFTKLQDVKNKIQFLQKENLELEQKIQELKDKCEEESEPENDLFKKFEEQDKINFPKEHFNFIGSHSTGGYYKCKHCDWMDVLPSSHVEHCYGHCKYIQSKFDITYEDGEVIATEKKPKKKVVKDECMFRKK